jgi:serine/threonine protein phosphatase 1
MIVIGDVHGNFKTLKALLDQIPQEEKDKGVCFVGDLIDRGPDSRGVVEFVIQNKYHCVRGNHEDMMLSTCDLAVRQLKKGGFWWGNEMWTLNGGRETIESYLEVDDTGDRPIETLDEETLKKHMKWMETLPFYLEFKNIKNDDGRYLIVSHSHICNAWRHIKREEAKGNQPRSKILLDVIWGRPYNLKQIPDIYNIIGHTPIKNGPKIKKTYADVDTGCFYKGEPGFFKLTALQFPEMIVYQQENIDYK